MMSQDHFESVCTIQVVRKVHMLQHPSNMPWVLLYFSFCMPRTGSDELEFKGSMP